MTRQPRLRSPWGTRIQRMRTHQTDPSMRRSWKQLVKLCSAQRNARSSCVTSLRRHQPISPRWSKDFTLCSIVKSLSNLIVDVCINRLVDLFPSYDTLLEWFNYNLVFVPSLQNELRHCGLWRLLSNRALFGLHEAVCPELWYLFNTGKMSYLNICSVKVNVSSWNMSCFFFVFFCQSNP